MKHNLEIEFKTFITKEIYEDLLQKFELENNVFKQTNFYFDSKDLELEKQKIVLRIRQKQNNYKLTSKVHTDGGAEETHLLLNEDSAQTMLKDGFDASIINLNHFVSNICELSTYRVSTTYKNGVIFFDKSVYYGKTDYEIEYEADSLEQGQIDFESFLEEYNIPYVKSIRKSQRAYESYK